MNTSKLREQMEQDRDEAVRRIVREELASMGGDLLASHGAGSADPIPELATIGGYLLERFRKK